MITLNASFISSGKKDWSINANHLSFAFANLAKMLGHANIRMTQHYAKVLDSSILKDMMNVKSAIVNLG